MDTMILFALMACILICITIGAVIGVVITHELQELPGEVPYDSLEDEISIEEAINNISESMRATSVTAAEADRNFQIFISDLGKYERERYGMDGSETGGTSGGDTIDQPDRGSR